MSQNKHDIIRLRRGTSLEWSTSDPQPDGEILKLGEPGFELDTNKLKIGDGVSGWNELSYVTPDFINIVSAGGIADLTLSQQDDILEGTIVLTSNGARWIYTGSGSKTSEASYIQLADISPAWIQITSKPASLVGLADIASTAIGDFILATGNNTYQVTNFAESVDDRVSNLIIPGTGININYNDSGNSLAVSVSGLISNPTNNRLLTSRDNTTTGIDAESNLTFDGSALNVNGDVSANYYFGNLDGAVVVDCKNNTGSPITKGTPVYISGYFANGKVYIAPARSDDSTKMPALGLLSSTLNNGDEGTVHILGPLTNIDTQTPGYTIGQILYVAPTGGLTSTRPTAETHLIQNLGKAAHIANNGRLIVLGPARSNDVPNSISTYKLNIDNLQLDGNTISSTDSNGNIVLSPNGTGDVQVDADTLRVGDANTNATITTNGTGDLVLNTNSGSNSGSITIQDGTTGNIIIAPGSTNAYIQNHTNSLTYRIYRTTTDGSSTTLTTDGNSPGASNRLVIPAKTSWVFTVNISAYNETANEANGWIFRGVIGRNNSNTTAFVGDPIEENWISDIAASASVVADNTNEALQIDVVGIGGETIKWVGIVTLTQITGA